MVKWFKLCHVNKGVDDETPYEMYLEGPLSWTVKDMWNRAHNYYDFGAIVDVTDMSDWSEGRFCK